MSKESGNLHCQ